MSRDAATSVTAAVGMPAVRKTTDLIPQLVHASRKGQEVHPQLAIVDVVHLENLPGVRLGAAARRPPPRACPGGAPPD